MSTSITYIKDPLFQVDFQEFIPTKKQEEVLPFHQKVIDVALDALRYIKAFFAAIGNAAYLTLRSTGASFKHLVLGYGGFPLADIHLLAFKIVFWVMSMVWCFMATSHRLFMEKIYPHDTGYLSDFAGGEIDIDHFRTKEIALDATGVPKDVTVNSLLAIYDQINFTKQVKADKPGEILEKSLTEDKKSYSVKELRTHLETFVKKVNTREAFVGTPPQYDTPRLMAFYQQIEDAVRLTIYKHNQMLADFIKEHGNDSSKYDKAAMNKYKGLLEDKNRMVIDLAIAGIHCGGRYMGDAMTAYSNCYGDNISDEGTLDDSLIEILAQKRKQIGEAHIQKYLGSDTHSYTKYMQNMGRTLAIPGTKNIIEHLFGLDQRQYLIYFFKDYTVDVIIETIQERVKKSQAFREKILDWIKDQSRDWKKGDYQEPSQDVLVNLNKIIQAKYDDLPAIGHIKNFQLLISELNQKKVKFPKLDGETGWNDFLDDLFALDEVKAWAGEKFKTLSKMERANLIQNFKNCLSQEELGSELLQVVKNAITKDQPLDIKLFVPRFTNLHKAGEMQGEFYMDKDTYLRVLQGDAKLEAAIKNRLEIERGNDFLQNMNLTTIDKNGLSMEILEWLLVSHKILLPQVQGQV